MPHISVLLHEAIDGMNLAPGDIFLDATVGSAGHTLEVFRRLKDVRIIALDADPARVGEASENILRAQCRAEVFHENFRNLDRALATAGLATTESVNAILFDLGLNSEQLTGSGRGFSFKKDEPLLMTYDEPSPGDLTARDIVNHFDEREISRILREYGEERYAASIARSIARTRKEHPIKTTGDLLAILKRTLPANYERGRIHFATRTFQALRIAVNDELGALSEGLAKAFQAIVPNGRIAVIAFQSLEDRIVKNFFRGKAAADEAALVNKKPIYPQEPEVKDNPRSRSAGLRILQKTSKLPPNNDR